MTKTTFKILVIGESQVGCSTYLSQYKKYSDSVYKTLKRTNTKGSLRDDASTTSSYVNEDKEEKEKEKEKIKRAEEKEIKSIKKIVTVENCKYMLEVLDQKSFDYNKNKITEGGDSNIINEEEELIKEYHGFVLIYDITKLSSTLKLKEMYEKIIKLNTCNYRSIMLIGNKNDLKNERVITHSQGEEFAENFDCNFTELSSKNNIEEVGYSFTILVEDLVLKRYQSMTMSKSPSSIKNKKRMTTILPGLNKRSCKFM